MEIKDETRKTRTGYIRVYKPKHKYSQTRKGWILQHREVVENFLKRSLGGGECVHHIDFDKSNNDIKNLMLFKDNSKHQSFHRKLQQFGLTNNLRKQIENRWKAKVYII